MAKDSAIEWTDATWNPWMGCKKVSAGCKNCYMFRDQKRFGHDPTVVRRSKSTFRDPLKWKRPRMIFVCSWSDFFLEAVPPEWRQKAWDIMCHAKQHTFLLLTKRPENIEEMLPTWWWSERHPNIWLGVSAENQAMADLRIPQFLQVPAAVHFVSAEPLLGPINLAGYLVCQGCGYTAKDKSFNLDHHLCTNPTNTLDWVISGGESDLSNPRTMEPEWAFDIRDQCVKAGVAFFHKQHGGSRKIDGAWGGRELDGRTWDEVPQLLTPTRQNELTL